MHCTRLRTFSSAGFPALSLVPVAEEPHSHELTHAASRSPQMEAGCFIQRLLRFPDVEARCKCGFMLSLLLSSFFWPLEETVFYLTTECVVSHGHGRFSPFVVAIAKKRLFVRATVNFLWLLPQFMQNKYFPPPPFIFPLHLCLKTGNWSRASKCNLAQRLNLPPNDTHGCSSLLRRSCTHYP